MRRGSSDGTPTQAKAFLLPNASFLRFMQSPEEHKPHVLRNVLKASALDLDHIQSTRHN